MKARKVLSSPLNAFRTWAYASEVTAGSLIVGKCRCALFAIDASSTDAMLPTNDTQAFNTCSFLPQYRHMNHMHHDASTVGANRDGQARYTFLFVHSSSDPVSWSHRLTSALLRLLPLQVPIGNLISGGIVSAMVFRMLNTASCSFSLALGMCTIHISWPNNSLGVIIHCENFGSELVSASSMMSSRGSVSAMVSKWSCSSLAFASFLALMLLGGAFTSPLSMPSSCPQSRHRESVLWSDAKNRPTVSLVSRRCQRAEAINKHDWLYCGSLRTATGSAKTSYAVSASSSIQCIGRSQYFQTNDGVDCSGVLKRLGPIQGVVADEEGGMG